MIDPNNNKDEAYESIDSMVIGEEADEGGWTLLPAGIYIFTVANVETGYHEPGPNSKLPPCWKVIVTFDVRDAAGNTGRVVETLFCTKKQSWKIKNLFVAAGLVKREDKEFSPNWKGLLGHDGVLKLKVRKYTDKDGNQREANNVEAFLDPEDGKKALEGADGEQQQAPAQTGFKFPGQQ